MFGLELARGVTLVSVGNMDQFLFTEILEPTLVPVVPPFLER